jgi:hypothetical protein
MLPLSQRPLPKFPIQQEGLPIQQERLPRLPIQQEGLPVQQEGLPRLPIQQEGLPIRRITHYNSLELLTFVPPEENPDCTVHSRNDIYEYPRNNCSPKNDFYIIPDDTEDSE